MLENLFIMERLVVQNQYHYRQAAYRGLEDIIRKSFIATLTYSTGHRGHFGQL